MPNIKALLLDMDGVLWRGEEPIGHLPDVFAAIEAKQLKLAFVTNNATRSADHYVEKFASMGIQVPLESVLTSAIVTANVLKQQHPDGGNVFVVGEPGLQDALQQAGFQLSDKDCLAVVAGLDRSITYDKLATATLLIRSGVPFIGTNPDKTLPSPVGQIPGAGSVLAALETASAVSPTIIGKPSPALLDTAMQRLGVSPEESLMVGDRIETDILAGQNAGTRTALVLSGVTSEQAARQWNPAPDYIELDLMTLVSKL